MKLIECKTREEWLEERRGYISGTDAAAILGQDPRRGPLAVWNSKVNGSENRADNKWMAYGRGVESAIGDAYAFETGRPVRDIGATTLCVSGDVPWMAVTLDRTTKIDEVDATLELKSVQAYGITPDKWALSPKIENQIQAQMQMFVTQFVKGSIAGMFPGYQLAWHDTAPNEDFLAAAIPRLEDFWRMVVDKTPPPPDPTPESIDAANRIYAPTCDNAVELTERCEELMDALEQTRLKKKDALKNEKLLRAQIMAEMNGRGIGVLPSGQKISAKLIKRDAYTAEVAASSYTMIRRVR